MPSSECNAMDAFREEEFKGDGTTASKLQCWEKKGRVGSLGSKVHFMVVIYFGGFSPKCDSNKH